MEFSRVIAVPPERVGQCKETLDLPLGEVPALIRETVRDAEVREHARHTQVGEGEYLFDAFDIARVGSEAVHAGIYLYVYVDVPPEGREGASVVRLGDRLREMIARKALKALGCGPAEDEYHALDPGSPELNTLCRAGHGKGAHAAAVQEPCSLHRTVPVGLALEDGHQLAAARENGAQILRVLTERIRVDLDPGTTPVIGPGRSYSAPDKQNDCRCRCGAEANRNIMPNAVFNKQFPKTDHASGPAHYHYHPGVQDVDEQRKRRKPARGPPARDE